jgi:peptidoglycan/LPS O-acetylase OafA/YrhL
MEYLSFPTLKYWVANLLFLNFIQPNLPGLFEGNALQAVNGALWTLKIEVMFYLAVPLVVMAFRKFGRLPVLATLYAGSLLYSLLMITMANNTGSGLYLELQRQLPGQFTFFIVGAAAYYYFQYLARYATWLVAAALTAFFFQDWLPWVAIQPLALGMLVIYFACMIPSLGHFGKYGDFSYGIYIVHFPILQLLISYNLFKTAPWMMLLVSVGLVIFTASLLWHFVEKPFLRKSSHYVAENQK